MNEQDFMKQIDEQTKNIPIPNSISPENMKKMLDQQAREQNTYDNNKEATNTETQVLKEDNKMSTRNRMIRRYTTAACFMLCLLGGVTAIHVNNHLKSETADVYESAAAEESMEETMDEAVADSVESQTEKGSDGDLVYQSSLQSPSSYDAYYETLSSAYQEYYDNLSVVTNEDTFLYEEPVAGAMEESVVADKTTMATGDGIRDFSENSNTNEKQNAEKEFSSTNTQEKTVDEGDIIKTDGTYIYKVISKFDNNTGCTQQTLTITETDDGDLKAISSIDLSTLVENTENIYLDFHEFYLYKDYIVLLYTKADYSTETARNETNIVVYNVRDKENPKKMKTLTQSGWYESSRISDGYLYTISNFNEANLDTPTPYTNYIPSVNGKTVECSNIYYPRNIMLRTTYVVTSLDLNNPQEFADTAAIPTNGGQTYVSDSSIYFYTTLYNEVTKTEITKLRYQKGTLTPGESATITGYLYDSFALSEYDNHLRIVATIPANNVALLRDITRLGATATSKNTDQVEVKEDVNVLYILNDNMQLTGKISGIAPGEQIYSARFMGDIGYFVTFRNTDPLFSVDLSDPANPTILGQLKIPGFSNYLHVYEEDLLLGLGEEIDANTGEFLGLKLSMFDISDPTNVSEQDKYIIEDATFSTAQHNHKALMIDPKKNIFGFLYSCIHEADYRYTYYYATYTYDKTEGFIETARYEIKDDSEYKTDAVRGIYICNYLYIATNKSITSYEIGSTHPISQIYFK